MSICCCHQTKPTTPPLVRRCRELAAWAFPTAMFALMPKCPACLVAYVAIWTGFGLSITTASYLRTSLLVFCAVSLLYLIVSRLILKHLVRFMGLNKKIRRDPVEFRL